MDMEERKVDELEAKFPPDLSGVFSMGVSFEAQSGRGMVNPGV